MHSQHYLQAFGLQPKGSSFMPVPSLFVSFNVLEVRNFVAVQITFHECISMSFFFEKFDEEQDSFFHKIDPRENRRRLVPDSTIGFVSYARPEQTGPV